MVSSIAVGTHSVKRQSTDDLTVRASRTQFESLGAEAEIALTLLDSAAQMPDDTIRSHSVEEARKLYIAVVDQLADLIVDEGMCGGLSKQLQLVRNRLIRAGAISISGERTTYRTRLAAQVKLGDHRR